MIAALSIPSKGSYVTNKNMKLIKEEQLKKIELLLDKAVTIAKISNIDFKSYIKEDIIKKTFPGIIS